MENVPNPEPEREPLAAVDAWAAMSDEELTGRLRAAADHELAGMDAATPEAEALADLLTPEPVHYDPGALERLTLCDLNVPELDPRHVTTDPADATCPTCTAALVDSKLPPEPAEHRTVGLEVLTAELRGAADYLLPVTARVGIVLRVDGDPVSIPEADSTWSTGYRTPPDILCILLRQARLYADGGIEGETRAELLMPTPDVLAALAGRPVGRYTAAVPSSYGTVQPGWLVDVQTNGPDGPGQAWLLVEDTAPCPDPATCAIAGGETYGCRVVTVRGVGIRHLETWRPVHVRIPADTEVEQ